MKITCGTDIIEIDRIKESIEEKTVGEAFKKRVYTDQEIEYCESKKNQKYQHYAARFAAKEAVFKAISEQLKNKYSITWKNIEVINNKQGKPTINIKDITNEKLEIKNIDISISHCKNYAVANAIVIF